MKKSLLILLTLLSANFLSAQESTSSYNILRFPISSHAAALGGENITLIEDNAAAGWSNPALLSGVSDKSLGLSYATYIADGNIMGAQFVKAFGERHTASLSAQYLNY